MDETRIEHGIVNKSKLELLTMLYNLIFNKNVDDFYVFKYIYESKFGINTTELYNTLNKTVGFPISIPEKQKICSLFGVFDCSELDIYIKELVDRKIITFVKENKGSYTNGDVINTTQKLNVSLVVRNGGTNGTASTLTGAGVGGLLGLLLFPGAPVLGLAGGAVLGGLAGYGLSRRGGYNGYSGFDDFDDLMVTSKDYPNILSYITKTHGKNANENDLTTGIFTWGILTGKTVEGEDIDRIIMMYNNRRVGGAPTDPTYGLNDYKLIQKQVKNGRVVIGKETIKGPWRKVDMRSLLAKHGKSLRPKKVFRISEDNSKDAYYQAVADAIEGGYIVKTRIIKKKIVYIPTDIVSKFPPGLKWPTPFIKYIKANYPHYEVTFTSSSPAWQAYKKLNRQGGCNGHTSYYAHKRNKLRQGGACPNYVDLEKLYPEIHTNGYKRSGGICPCKTKKKKKKRYGGTATLDSDPSSSVENILNMLNNIPGNIQNNTIGPLNSNFYDNSVYQQRKNGLLETMNSLQKNNSDIPIHDLASRVLNDDAGVLGMPWGTGGRFNEMINDLTQTYQGNRIGGAISFSDIRRGIARKAIPPFTIDAYLEKRDFFLDQIDTRLISIQDLNEYVLGKRSPVDLTDDDEIAIKIEINTVFDNYNRINTPLEYKWGIGTSYDKVIERVYEDWIIRTTEKYRCNHPENGITDIEMQLGGERIRLPRQLMKTPYATPVVKPRASSSRPPSYNSGMVQKRLSNIETQIKSIQTSLGKLPRSGGTISKVNSILNSLSKNV